MKKIKIISLILFILFCILAFIFGIIYHDTTNNVLVDYDNKTNIINILSDKDFDTCLLFLVQFLHAFLLKNFSY